MSRLDLSTIQERTGSAYPTVFTAAVEGRTSKRVGDAGGLTQFGVNIVTLQPGAASSHRHWHENEDEFAYVLEGEMVLIENEGETIVRPGDCIAWPANVANGHCLVNRSQAVARFLVVGTKAKTERAHYPDIDLAFISDADGRRFTRKSGEPY